ncbi:hypothetical protein D8674_006007 [Pyrus ussuriensis x Pyrus communis]|uniref:Uncharacterized protein n=1 Tax=Pyrus ussuriensis x Pyrus communis TaxID=2448454 RepID=A0A5N5FY30_9ROSA|nr:hypothetical protein D8674_006007 [Pyrus ussuriensis x Pyrus communis]
MQIETISHIYPRFTKRLKRPTRIVHKLTDLQILRENNPLAADPVVPEVKNRQQRHRPRQMRKVKILFICFQLKTYIRCVWGYVDP